MKTEIESEKCKHDPIARTLGGNCLDCGNYIGGMPGGYPNPTKTDLGTYYLPLSDADRMDELGLNNAD